MWNRSKAPFLLGAGGSKWFTVRAVNPGFFSVKWLHSVASLLPLNDLLVYHLCNVSAPSHTLSWGMATWTLQSLAQKHEEHSQVSNPDLSSGGSRALNQSLLFVLLFAENLIKIIEKGDIDEIADEVTPKAMAQSGRNALLVAMEVCWRNLSQCMDMNSELTFSLTYHRHFQPNRF